MQGRDTRFEYKSPIFTGFQRQISQYIQNFSDDHALTKFLVHARHKRYNTITI